MNIDATNLNLLWSSLIIEQLVLRGIKRFFVSPGHRCAPILYILNKRKDIQVTVIPDERSASYHALGAIKATKEAAVLVCTSGTAVANYFPAIIEAFSTSLPLVVITSDRPFDAWGVDANQSIDQKQIYGGFVGHALNLPHPTLDVSVNHLVAKIANSLNQLYFKRKPIHINFPLKEPLETQPQSIPESYYHDTFNHSDNDLGQIPAMKSEVDLSLVKATLAKAQRPLVIVGQLENEEMSEEKLALIEIFLQKISVPFFLDITSGLKYRVGLESKKGHIYYLDHPESLKFVFEDYRPDLILHLGGRLVSNNYYRRLSQQVIFEVQVAPGIENRDPSSRVMQRVPLFVSEFCRVFSPESLENRVCDYSTTIIHQLNLKLKKKLDDSNILGHATIVRQITKHLKDDDALFLGNSFSIRAFDQYYLGERVIKSKVITNRGVSGIEGFVSMSRGYHQSQQERVVLVLGDISLIHDFSALLYLQKKDNIKIIVINNQRGGIFSTLPIKNYEGVLNPLVESPHDMIFSSICEKLPFHTRCCKNLTDFNQVLSCALRETDKDCWFIEACIDHEKDIEEYHYLKN